MVIAPGLPLDGKTLLRAAIQSWHCEGRRHGLCHPRPLRRVFTRPLSFHPLHNWRARLGGPYVVIEENVKVGEGTESAHFVF